MAEYLGSLGRLVPLRTSSRLAVSAQDRYRVQTTLEGRRRAQIVPASPRQWSLSWNGAQAPSLAALSDFVSGAWGAGPWHWVPVLAQRGNLLTPRQASFLDREPGGSWNDGPPLQLPDGAWAPRTLVSTMTSAYNMFFRDLPVLPGRAVTYSAWLVGDGTNVPQLALNFYDSAGGTLDAGGAFESAPDAEGIHRVSMTRVPPEGSVSAAVGVTWRSRRVALPQVTWTDGPVPYSAGHGCRSAIVDGWSEDLIVANSYGTYSNAGFTVMEVG